MGKSVAVHDVGAVLEEEAAKLGIRLAGNLFLDLDQKHQSMLRALAAKEVGSRIQRQPETELHLIGTHAIFPWRGRLLAGISFADVLDFDPDGFLNIVDDVGRVHSTNAKNPRWFAEHCPDLAGTQKWMLEEEFITESLAGVVRGPFYVLARRHNISNLADLFFKNKKRVYLSYPITAIREENPSLLEQVQGEFLRGLEQLFVVFDPLTIKDMALTYDASADEQSVPVQKLTPEERQLIVARTVERDYQFIDQSDAIVVLYATDKVSPGVISEISYAHRNMKKVFVFFTGKKSPFLVDSATAIADSMNELTKVLVEFAASPAD